MKLYLRSPPAPDLRIGEQEDMSIGIGDVTVVHYDAPPYEGEYEVTPSRETQVLSTEGKTMIGDVVVNPIPPQYGLIEYNGIYIRVS